VILSPSCVHRDFEKIPDNSFSGSDVCQRLQTAISFWKWNNNTSSWYRCFVSVLGIQYDPQYFPEPENFDPGRFKEENKRSRPNYTYIPFGEGLRMCIVNTIPSIMNYKIVYFKDMRVK